MKISFQHANPSASHDSTLLTVTPESGRSYQYLIDAGESISSTSFSGPEEPLDGVFLTHAHSDHYDSLGQVLSSAAETPLFTSPATATILEQVYSEADRYRDLGDSDAIEDALTPIASWTTLTDEISVLPVPAGHTPGAAAFLFRIDDLEYNHETVTILVTGDFTMRSVAGYSGLTIPKSIAIDILIANAATSEDFAENLSKALETILERALSGATTLVAASALTGIHVAYVLGHMVERLDRTLPIHLAGQAAKLYNSLEYTVPSVTPRAHFEHTDDVLTPGAVTIAGPEAPTQGSTSRLLGVVEENPDAVFIQLTTSSPEISDGLACATYDYRLSNHPTREQFLSMVDTHLPRHLILKHSDSESIESLESSVENLFHWGNTDTNSHVLYNDGSWVAPHWVSDSGERLIRQRNYRESDQRIPLDRPVNKLPTVPFERQGEQLQNESIELDPLIEKFESTQPQQPATQQKSASDGGQTSPVMADHNESDDKSVENTEESGTDQQPQIDDEFQSEVIERLETIESSLDEIGVNSRVEDTIRPGIDTIETRLGDVETTLENLPEQLARNKHQTLTGTVVRQNDLVLLRIDPERLEEIEESLTHNEEVEILLHRNDNAETE